MKQFINFILYSNIFIALCSIAFLLSGYLLSHSEMKVDALTLFIFFSTLFTYLLIRIAAKKRIIEYKEENRWNYFIMNFKLMQILTILSFSICIILFFYLKEEVQFSLLLPGCISILYGIPFRKFRLRDIGIVKIFMISFVWAFAGSILPILNSQADIHTTAIIILYLSQYFFIFAITLPFDIKDMDIDTQNNVKTIPVILGIDNTYNLSAFCLFISGALQVYLQKYLLNSDFDYTIPFSTSILITGLLIYATRYRKSNMIYFGLLDGMILLQFVLLFSYTLMH